MPTLPVEAIWMVNPLTLTGRSAGMTACAASRFEEFVAVLIEHGASAMVPGRRLVASGRSMNELVRLGYWLITVATVLLLPLAGALPISAQTLEDALTTDWMPSEPCRS